MELRGCFSSFRVWAEAVSPGCTRKRGGGDGGGKGGVLRSRSTTEGGRPRSLYNWKPVFGTKLLRFSIGRGSGALKGLREAYTCEKRGRCDPFPLPFAVSVQV